MPDRPAYLLLLASATERRQFADYVAAVSPLLSRYGGRHLALAPATTVEAFGHNDGPMGVMLSSWTTTEQLRGFWTSREHHSLAALRTRIGAFVAVGLDGSGNEPAPIVADEVVAIFLGAGPSPALLEAEGARPLALVREPQVETLEGMWIHGNVAIYGWASAQRARRQMVLFSSGQRARAMLVPTLRVQVPTAQQARESMFAA